MNPVGTTTPTTPIQPDTTLPEAEITIDVIAEDGVINLKESQETNTTITGTVGKDVKAGDTVLVGYLMGDVAKATISDANPALFLAIGIFVLAFIVLYSHVFLYILNQDSYNRFF